MAIRKPWLRILGVGAGVVVALGLSFVWWRYFHTPYETTLMFENQSGQSVHDLRISHNDRTVYRIARFDHDSGVVIKGLDPLRGFDSKNTLTHPNWVEAWFAISFRRTREAEVESHILSAHQGEYLEKCLLAIMITPRSIERRGRGNPDGCYWIVDAG